MFISSFRLGRERRRIEQNFFYEEEFQRIEKNFFYEEEFQRIEQNFFDQEVLREPDVAFPGESSV